MAAVVHRDPFGRLITPWSIVEVPVRGRWRRGRVVLLRRKTVAVEIVHRQTGRVRVIFRQPARVYVVRGE